MKVFISQPMRDKTVEEIELEREEIMQHLREKFGKDVEELPSYFEETGPESDRDAMKLLGKSIALMADADLVYFAHGWENSRGCSIENNCAITYGLDVIEDYRKGA